MENTNKLVQFDVVSDESDHMFVGDCFSRGKCFTDTENRVYRAIMREWKILQQNLPESIYVRVYERRINLMRAVIVGAMGTPYHDGLFFFDIVFPSDYPNHPPRLHYRSYGRGVNPNLYKTGKVCLSLLNTWRGKQTEKWDPCRSTMLQVLLSIQGLVLNEKPFFNEPLLPFFAIFFGFDNNSRGYNEHVFISTLKTSISQLRRPPLNLQDIVRGHFRQRASQILAACNEYMNGRVTVGYYSSHLHSSSSSTVKVSRDFKKQVIELYPQLVQVFRQNGAVLDGLVEQPEIPSMQSEQPNYLILISLFFLLAAVCKVLVF